MHRLRVCAMAEVKMVVERSGNNGGRMDISQERMKLFAVGLGSQSLNAVKGRCARKKKL